MSIPIAKKVEFYEKITSKVTDLVSEAFLLKLLMRLDGLH
jgi:hypothetical protein